MSTRLPPSLCPYQSHTRPQTHTDTYVEFLNQVSVDHLFGPSSPEGVERHGRVREGRPRLGGREPAGLDPTYYPQVLTTGSATPGGVNGPPRRLSVSPSGALHSSSPPAADDTPPLCSGPHHHYPPVAILVPRGRGGTGDVRRRGGAPTRLVPTEGTSSSRVREELRETRRTPGWGDPRWDRSPGVDRLTVSACREGRVGGSPLKESCVPLYLRTYRSGVEPRLRGNPGSIRTK